LPIVRRGHAFWLCVPATAQAGLRQPITAARAAFPGIEKVTRPMLRKTKHRAGEPQVASA
jgi:hypothetical protein